MRAVNANGFDHLFAVELEILLQRPNEIVAQLDASALRSAPWMAALARLPRLRQASVFFFCIITVTSRPRRPKFPLLATNG